MALGSGMAAQIGYAPEVTAGTPVTVTDFLPLLEESLTSERTRMESEAIIAGRRTLASRNWAGASIAPGGDVGHELYPLGAGTILEALFGTASTSGPSGGFYTHAWTSLGEPKPVTIQVGRPTVGGVVIPMTYAGCMAESWELAVEVDAFARLGVTWAGIHEIGHRSVADGATTSGSAAITSATALFDADDVGKPISGTGIPASTTVLSVQSSTAATLSANASATGTGVTFTIGVALATASYPSGLRPFTYHQASLSIASGSVDVKALTLSGTNGLATDRWFLGRRTRKQPIEAGLHEITGTATVEWENRGQYDRFIREQEMAMVLALAHPTGQSLTFTMNVRFDGATPNVGGTEIVTQEIPFKAVGDTDGDAFDVSWVSVDATP